MMYGKIEQDGFVSEYEYAQLDSEETKVYFAVTGHFVQLKNDPKALFLFDDHSRIYHPMSKVSFLWRTNNPKEGDKKYPKPFITEQTAEEKQRPNYKYGSKVVSVGDKVKITYVHGNIYAPLVEGSIEPFVSFAQHKFLLTKPEEWSHRKSRYETDDYIFEFHDNAKGELSISIEAKEEGAGTGNITLDLIGKAGNGNIAVNTNGKITISQKDADGTIVQSMELDNTDSHRIAKIMQGDKQLFLMDETIGMKLKGSNGAEEFMVNGDTLQEKLEAIIDNIKTLVFMTNTGATVGLNPASITALDSLKATFNTILVK